MTESVRTDIKGIERFVFEEGADRGKLSLHISEVGPGERAHAPHSHDGQEIFYVFSGEGEVLFGEQTHQVKENEAVHVDCTVIHGIRNIGDSPLRYAVIIAK